MSFSENLLVLRNIADLSQEQLAEKLGVSRQAVSKWESGQSYPETEKIIMICDLFKCSMDELMTGKISSNNMEIKTLYENYYNRLAMGVSLGVGLIILGVAVYLKLSEYSEEMFYIGLIPQMLCVVIAIPIFVYLGIENRYFKKANPVMPNIYSDKEILEYSRKYALILSFSIALIICDAIMLIVVNNLNIIEESSTLAISLFMLIMAIAVSITIYNSIQHSKYDINKYNISAKNVSHNNNLPGLIMLITTLVFLLLGFLLNLWYKAWIVFPIAGILIAIVEMINKGLNNKKD